MHEPTWEDLLNTFDPAALHAAGTLPFPNAPHGNSAPFIDLGRITTDVFGVTLDPKEGRKTLAAKLEHLFRAQKDPATGKRTWAQRRGDVTADIAQSGWPIVGRMNRPAVLLQAVTNYAADALEQIRPIENAGRDSCNHEPIANLIRTTLAALNAQFASGKPLVPEVNALVDTLVGNGTTDCGYVGVLEERCGIGTTCPCTVEDEKVIGRFAGLKELATVFAKAWREPATGGDEGFFTLAAQEIQRYLLATAITVRRLRGHLSDIDLATADVPSMPGVNAGRILEWIQRVATTSARDMMREGRDGIRSVEHNMSRIDEVLTGFSGETDDTSDSEAVDPCSGLPRMFANKKVQPLFQELRCHVAQIRKIAADARCTPEPTC